MPAGQPDVNNPPLRISSQVVILAGDKLKLINHHNAFYFIFLTPHSPCLLLSLGPLTLRNLISTYTAHTRSFAFPPSFCNTYCSSFMVCWSHTLCPLAQWLICLFVNSFIICLFWGGFFHVFIIQDTNADVTFCISCLRALLTAQVCI